MQNKVSDVFSYLQDTFPASTYLELTTEAIELRLTYTHG